MTDPLRKLRPFELARWQRARDRELMRRMPPVLLARKQARMSTSPFAFLRGSAPLFYRVLRNAPRLARGPEDEGLLCGDLHLENFGAYRPDRPSRQDRVVFDINDADESFFGYLHLDVLRVLTSVLLAARGWGCAPAGGLELAGALLDGYRRGRGGGRPVKAPAPVSELLARVGARKRRELLEKRTVAVGDRRRFRIGDNFLKLPRDTQAACARAFRRFAAEQAKQQGHPPERFTVLDVAFRVAGLGSLGRFRVAVLAEGHGTVDGAWMFDMKEMAESAGTAFATHPMDPGPGRVANALRTLLGSPPVMLGNVRAVGRGLLVRRLTPQEDRLDWMTIRAEQREPTLAFLGALTAAAHRRCARRPPAPLDAADARRLLKNAAELAGIHEAVALAYAAELHDG